MPPRRSVSTNDSLDSDVLLMLKVDLYMKSFGLKLSVLGMGSFARRIAGTATLVMMFVSSASFRLELRDCESNTELIWMASVSHRSTHAGETMWPSCGTIQ